MPVNSATGFPLHAAARRGMPAPTLESRIRHLGIDNFRYRRDRFTRYPERGPPTE